MSNNYRVERKKIKTEDIERINRFSSFVSKLQADFNWTVCQQYLSRRDKLVSMLSDHWGQTKKSTLEDVKNHIEKGCSSKLAVYSRKTLGQGEDSKMHPVCLNKKSLNEIVDIAGAQVASMFEAVRALKQYRSYYLSKERELLSKEDKTPLAMKKALLSRLEGLTGDLDVVIPKLAQTASHALTKMKGFISEFASVFDEQAHKMFVLASHDGAIEFCLSSSLFEGQGACKTNLPIYLEGEDIQFHDVEFGSVDLYCIDPTERPSVQLEKCKGAVSLSGVQRGRHIGISDSPALSAEVVHCSFESMNLSQYVDNVRFDSVQADSLSVSGIAAQLTLDDCRIGEVEMGTAAINHIRLTGSKARIRIKEGAEVGYLGMDSSSAASVLMSDSRLGRLRPGTHAHVISHGSTIGEINLQDTKMAFIDCTRTQVIDVKRAEVGLYQDISAPDGSQYTLFSSQQLQESHAPVLDMGGCKSTGQAAYLTDLVANDWKAAEFFGLENSAGEEGARHVLLKSAALSLTRSGITPRDTAWEAISTGGYESFGEGSGALTEITQDVACADFMLWRADHFPEEHTAIVAKIPTAKRMAALHYMKEMADRRVREEAEIRQEMARFNMEIAGISVLARAWRLIAEYQPGEMSPWSKHKAKNDLMRKLQQLIVDEELSAEEIAKRALLVFQESKKTFSGAWKQGKAMGTFFGLAEQMIEKYQRASMLARQIDQTIELELKGKESRLYQKVLERHIKRRESMILTDAVAITLNEMESIISRHPDSGQVASLNSICAQETVMQFKHELSKARRLEVMLDQVYQLAIAYSPVISTSGPGKQKLKIMRQLAGLVSDSSKNAVDRRRELVLSLKTLQQENELRQEETSNPFIAGFALWTKRSREKRGYKVVLTKIANLLEKSDKPAFWPEKQGPGDIEYFAVPNMDQAMMARQHKLFQRRKEIQEEIEKKKKIEDRHPTCIRTH